MRSISLFALTVCVAFPSSSRAQAPSDPVPAAASPASAVSAAPSVYPLDAVVTPDGAVVVVDRNLPGLWQWKNDQLSILVQGSKRFREPLNAARSLALDKDGKILVGDSSTREIYRVDQSGSLKPLTGGKIGIPMDIGVRKDGSLVVADLETRRVLSVSADGQEIKPLAELNPRGLCVDSQDQIWVVSQNPQQLQVIGTDGKVKEVVSKRTFEFPSQVVVNSKGEAFVSDNYKKAIWKVVEGREPVIVVSGLPLDNPVGLALHQDQLIIVDPRASQVFRLVADAKLEAWFTIKK